MSILGTVSLNVEVSFTHIHLTQDIASDKRSRHQSVLIRDRGCHSIMKSRHLPVLVWVAFFLFTNFPQSHSREKDIVLWWLKGGYEFHEKTCDHTWLSCLRLMSKIMYSLLQVTGSVQQLCICYNVECGSWHTHSSQCK